MLFNPLACALLAATTFVSIQASPVSSELLLKEGKKERRVLKKFVTQANKVVTPIYPNIDADATYDHVEKKWQQDKDFVLNELDERIKALDILSKQPNKVQGIDKSHGHLNSAHNIVEGWKKFYQTEQGRKFDSCSSRLIQASQHANHIRQVIDASDYFHKETNKWEKQKVNLQEQVGKLKAQYKSDDNARMDLHLFTGDLM
jgi:hypothetical protein